MCGIFGAVGSKIKKRDIRKLGGFAQQRGQDSSGFLISSGSRLILYRADQAISKSLKYLDTISDISFVMGHSRLVTNGMTDNQPVFHNGACVIHNGIIVNADSLWKSTTRERLQQIDTEIITALVADHIDNGGSVEEICEVVLSACRGVVACAIALPKLGKLCLFSNNGSLYAGVKDHTTYFASEKFPLSKIHCREIVQIREHGLVLDIAPHEDDPDIEEFGSSIRNLVPALGAAASREETLLEYRDHSLRRCSRCILPETMPYIEFNELGVCNYCTNYSPRNTPKPFDQLERLIEPYRRGSVEDCIVPFSGGRDSCYSLHLICNELKMKPIAYTYDWGMVTDLGRRNISRMCAQLGVENIIVADDIVTKRQNIATNFKAWLKSPHLGMVSILTAGDKHFFRHVETVKQQTDISLNLWGVNPLEVTHFKAGFLGVPPNFAEERVYSSGTMKQLRYQWLRLRAMAASPSYFNSSLWDTLSGEYYRSFHKKTDYFHLFDYWRWDEREVDNTLINRYDWETAPDTNTTWRIGDGTAAIYNYIYYTVAGFTEHDTFRSNQIREGDLSREEALELVSDENRPRYPNIKWYLDAIGMDFDQVIPVINNIPKLKPEAWQ
ncbi:glucosamine 6-phosphate synthetase [Rhodobacterales bacterium LSUCC0246]|nr:glucosamine 6-phosphate synthetase [Rhodobacterales bacterium LSUCC0374]